MLTVKHINIAGDETVTEAFGVELIRGTSSLPWSKAGNDPRGENDHVSVRISEDNLHTTLFGGTVFVMNRHGSTVARYDLGASPVPVPLGSPVLAGDDYTARVA